MNRRNFMRTALAASTVGLAGSFNRFGLLNAAAAPTGGYRALVCIFLYGGNDSNNMVIPIDGRYTDYSSIRQNLAIDKTTLLPFGAASSAQYGLHPNMPEVQKLGSAVAIVANVGSLVQPVTRAQYLQQGSTPVPINLFSHSDQQMQWQTSMPNGISTTGWAGRAADQVAHLNGSSTFPTFVSVAGNAIFGTGADTRPGSVVPGAPLGLTGFDTSAASMARKAALQEMLTFDSGVTLVQEATATMAHGMTDADTLSKALSGAAAMQTVFPKTSIGAQLQEVAKLIQVRQAMGMNRQIFFTSLGGFDTHTAQLNTQDTLLSQLSPAMSAFYAATEELGVADQVTAFTESDFSRTCQPNSNGGTDHAWGSHHLVMGAAVKGGSIYGAFPTLQLGGPDDAGNEGRWIPTTSIDQYGATLAQWFGVSAANLAAVFPNIDHFQSNNVGFLPITSS